MPKERIGEQVFVFFSEAYAQVTATVFVTPKGAVVVDTLLYPSEAQEVAAFARQVGGKVAYLINTHGHLDHVSGNYLYSEAQIISHSGARKLMEKQLALDLNQARMNIPELRSAQLRLPTMTASADMVLRFGGLTFDLMPLPGHTYDAFGVYLEEEKVLVAGDAILPLPHFAGCDPDLLIHSLQRVRHLSLNTIVQGHGEVILKGEVKETIDFRIRYLRDVKKAVSDAIAAGKSLAEVQHSDVEAFGGSHLDLDGLTQQLHEDNVTYLYSFLKERQAQAEIAFANGI